MESLLICGIFFHFTFPILIFAPIIIKVYRLLDYPDTEGFVTVFSFHANPWKFAKPCFLY